MDNKQGMRTFYTLILTQVFSLIGSRISGLAISIWVFQETQNATPLALVTFFAILPQVLASGLSGVLADRWDRRYVMMIADAGQAAGTVLLLISFLSGDFQLWHLYVVALIQAVFAVFQGPAFQASMTLLVPDEHRDRANAIQQITGPVAGIIAPAIAGIVFAAFNVAGAIVIDLATFLVAIAVVYFAPIPRPKRTAEGHAMQGSILRQMFDGFRYLWQRQALFWMCIYSSMVNFLVGGVMALETPYLLARTNNEATLGVLLSVVNLGALAGGIIMGIWGGTRPRIHTILPGLILGGIFLALAGMGQTPVVLGATLFMFMFMLPMVNAAAMSMLQAKVAPDVQGRVFASVGQLAMLTMPIALLLVGPLADQVFEPAVGQAGWSAVAPLVGDTFGAGMGLLLFVSGALTAILSVVIYLVPAVRHLEADLPDYEPQVSDAEKNTIEGSTVPEPVA